MASPSLRHKSSSWTHVAQYIVSDLNPGSFRHTIPPTVTTVIVKQQKGEWGKEFWNEKNAYDRLKELQGTIVPNLFGQGFFDGLPALIFSEVVGTTLFNVACSNKCKIEEERLKASIEQVSNAFSEYGVINWIISCFCDNGGCENSKVIVVDLEQVQFPGEFRPWQYLVDKGGAYSLVRDIRDIRVPDRESSPVRFWMSDNDQENSLKSGPS
ncbi:uncharacterized protein N7459_007077 [Penicillium hispanicum]|uniref:uncharacterized protein n=1 Tax=Penicillium hispanicum TaxID=1080232 RepID=UPI00254249B1|nr:uncharacterized protein N7459_007077 [Penicillium hispanicum]KAJ5578113.1 hypothetical protein N7459_007077 [Penicillium hispanicum]